MLLPLAFLTGTELLWSAIAFGLVFGFLLHRGGVTDFDVIVRLFQFRDFTVLKVMMTAIAVGGVGIAVLHGQDLAQYHIKATNLLAVGLGAGFVDWRSRLHCPNRRPSVNSWSRAPSS